MALGTAWAECVWQGQWLVCPSGSKYSEIEYSGAGSKFRYWNVYSNNDNTGFIEKYYEFDCEAKAYRVLEFKAPIPKYSSWEDFQAIKQHILTENHYFQPGDLHNQFCEGLRVKAEELKKQQQAKTQLPKKGTP